MSNLSSFQLRSRGVDMSASIASEAQRIARDAATPISAGDTIKAQLRRAWVNLGRPAYWRVRAAWYGESGCWSAAAFEDFRARYRAWRERQEEKGRTEAATLFRLLLERRDALAAIDSEFHRDEIERLSRALRAMGGNPGPGDFHEDQGRAQKDGD